MRNSPWKSKHLLCFKTLYAIVDAFAALPRKIRLQQAAISTTTGKPTSLTSAQDHVMMYKPSEHNNPHERDAMTSLLEEQQEIIITKIKQHIHHEFINMYLAFIAFVCVTTMYVCTM